jgi:hypothetical protein
MTTNRVLVEVIARAIRPPELRTPPDDEDIEAAERVIVALGLDQAVDVPPEPPPRPNDPEVIVQGRPLIRPAVISRRRVR